MRRSIMSYRMEAAFNKMAIKFCKWLFKTIWELSKVIIKLTIIIIAVTGREIKNIKKIIASKRERYMFIACTLLSFTAIAHYKDIRYSWMAIFSYFVIKGIIKETRAYLKARKSAIRIKILNKKYKKLIDRFDNKISIIDVHPDRITVFSNELTKTELEKHIGKFELFFNRKIAFIVRKNGDFKYNDIIFFVDTKFKKFYKFEDYINFVDMKKIKKMELPMVLGINQDEKILTADLVDIKYLFIAGESGGGKSVMLNCIIQSMMVFASTAIYVMVDLKEGVEMSDYNRFPNCLICSDKEEFSQVIKVINNIMKKRLKIIREMENCKNIQAYNAKDNTENMNYIILVIDEIAEIKLNSDTKSGRSEEETILLQILQKGRAAGVHVIGATQRPGVDQIDGSIRAGFHKSISFCVSTPETQRMTKIHGTETLKQGEFKTNILSDTGTIYKGFLILEESNKKKGLPKCNQVYEDLKHVLIDKKFFVEIKEKEVKCDKQLLQKILNKLNKKCYHLLTPLIDYHLLIKNPQSSLISEIDNIKTLSGLEKNPIENDTLKHGGNYENFLKFIFVNYKDDGEIPGVKETYEKTALSRKRRENLLKDALNDGFIKKKSKTKYQIDLDFPGWNRFKNKSIDTTVVENNEN